MQPLSTYRNWHIYQMKLSPSILEQLLKAADPALLNTKRDGGEDSGWTPTEVIGHLHYFEAIFSQRAQLSLDPELHEPDLPNEDPDEVNIRENYNARDIWQVFEEWVERRQQSIALFEDIGDDDAQWERAGTHPRRGRFSLNDQLTFLPLHDLLHIEQIAHTLAE